MHVVSPLLFLHLHPLFTSAYPCDGVLVSRPLCLTPACAPNGYAAC
jgi:hypothetical protein